MSLSSPPAMVPPVHRISRQQEVSALPGHNGPPRTAQFKTRQEQKEKSLLPTPPKEKSQSQSNTSGLVPITSKPSPYTTIEKPKAPPAFGGHGGGISSPSTNSSLGLASDARQSKSFPSLKGQQRPSFKDKYRASVEKKKEQPSKQGHGTGQLAIPSNLTSQASSPSISKQAEASSSTTASATSYPDLPGLGTRWDKSNISGSNLKSETSATRPGTQAGTRGEKEERTIAGDFRESLKRMTKDNAARNLIKIPSYTKRPPPSLSPSSQPPPQSRVQTAAKQERDPPQKHSNPISSTPSKTMDPVHGFINPSLPGQIA